MANDPLVGNWNEYQRLVLAELERHNTLLQGVDDRIQNLKLQLELMKQDQARLNEIEKQVRTNSRRLDKLEVSEETDDALKKYRRWIVGILFIFIASLLVPTLNLIVNVWK